MTQLTTQPAFQSAASDSTSSKRPAPFSLRLSVEERQRLEAAAGEQSLSAYIKARLFGEDAKTMRKARRPSMDAKLLAETLGKLGQSRLPQNMNQIAKAANLGTLPVLPETEEELRQACYDIAVMRMMLMKALGKSGSDAE